MFLTVFEKSLQIFTFGERNPYFNPQTDEQPSQMTDLQNQMRVHQAHRSH